MQQWFSVKRLNAKQPPFPAEPTRQAPSARAGLPALCGDPLERETCRALVLRKADPREGSADRPAAGVTPTSSRVADDRAHGPLSHRGRGVGGHAGKLQKQAASYPRSKGRLPGQVTGSPCERLTRSGRPARFTGERRQHEGPAGTSLLPKARSQACSSASGVLHRA